MAASKAFKLDMTRMYIMHTALRRDLERIAKATARSDDDPRRVMRTAVGWAGGIRPAGLMPPGRLHRRSVLGGPVKQAAGAVPARWREARSPFIR
jgi:hypothetical protein